MANEAILVWEKSKPIPMTAALAAAFEKGAVCRMISPLTLSGSGIVLASTFGGIVAHEKITNDGTGVSAYRDGIFRMYVSGSATVGDPAIMSESTNYVASGANRAISFLSGSKIVGSFLQTGTNGQQVLVEVNPQVEGT